MIVLELPRIDGIEAPVLERADEGVLAEAGVEVPRLQGSNAPPQSGLLRRLRSASLLPRHEERARDVIVGGTGRRGSVEVGDQGIEAVHHVHGRGLVLDSLM